MRSLSEHQPFIAAHNQETECRNWIAEYEAELHDAKIKAADEATGRAQPPTDIDSIVNGRIARPTDTINELSKKLAALRVLLPQLINNTNQTRKKFVAELSAERQDEYSSLEHEAMEYYLKVQEAILGMDKIIAEIENAAGEFAQIKQNLPALNEVKPDPYSGYFTDLYRGIKAAGIEIPTAITKAMAH